MCPGSCLTITVVQRVPLITDESTRATHVEQGIWTNHTSGEHFSGSFTFPRRSSGQFQESMVKLPWIVQGWNCAPGATRAHSHRSKVLICSLENFPACSLSCILRSPDFP
ncbi:Keratin, type I cytoskeletal 26 [Manis javanica]|nr:Keratin, type I cytoskeletal 26 [Manis javanica]